MSGQIELLLFAALTFIGLGPYLFVEKYKKIGAVITAIGLGGLIYCAVVTLGSVETTKPSINTKGGGIGGAYGGGGGGGVGARGGNGGTYIRGNQYNYPVQPQLDQPSFPDKPNMIALSLGSNTALVPTSEMREHAIDAFGPSGAGLLFNWNDLAPISFSLKNDELFISTDLYHGGSQPAVKLRNNAIVDMPIRWDRNSNHRALEIIDEKGCPVFQFIRKTAFKAVLSGSFTDRSGNRIFASDKGTDFGGRQQIGCELRPIFKYPAWKYPGQYAEP